MRTALFLLLLIWSGCGYKPTSLYTKEVLGDKIYTEVAISLEDPENTVLIKDAINEAVVSKFQAKLADIDQADSKLYISLSRVSFVPIQYDKNGYVIAYKTYVGLTTRYVDRKNKSHKIYTTGDYDFPIEANSLISDTKRFDAIKNAGEKALDAIRSKIAIGAMRDD